MTVNDWSKLVFVFTSKASREVGFMGLFDESFGLIEILASSTAVAGLEATTMTAMVNRRNEKIVRIIARVVYMKMRLIQLYKERRTERFDFT